MLENDNVKINGDGETSRDFCYIDNAVQANILAATAVEDNKNNVYNIAVGHRTSLNGLFILLKDTLAINNINYGKNPIYAPSRPGDVKHSQASIKKATQNLSYMPRFDVNQGISESVPWYVKRKA